MLFRSISGTSGLDTNTGYQPHLAFATLSKLNSVADGSGIQSIMLPTQLTESASFSQANFELTGSHATHRGFCGTTGTITSTNTTASQTYSYFTLGGFAKTGAGYSMLYDLTINNSFSDSSSGLIDAWNLQFNATTPISITGSGIKNFYNQRGGIFSINNASAKINVVTSDYISQFTLTAGKIGRAHV